MTSGVYMSAIQGENGGRGSYVYTKYDGHMYVAAGPNASPDIYHGMFQMEEEL